MIHNSRDLRRRLQLAGYSEPALAAAWPEWWSNDAESSPSAQAELRFSLARKLGIDPRSLIENSEPRFVWKTEAKFKHLATESADERAAISSYGIALGRIIIAATNAAPASIEGASALQLRGTVLASKPFVSLSDLLAVCWGVGIPVIHLRVFPLSAKRMCAMTVRIGARFAILLGKDSNYPASIAFYLAHELGHIALGHVRDGAAVVDLSDMLESKLDEEGDEEERTADRYALELLTGMSSPQVGTETQRFKATQLAANLLKTGAEAHIEPGVLALCFGNTTGDWAKANAAMKSIYTAPKPVWREVNRIAMQQLNFISLSDDLGSYIKAVTGSLGHD